MHITVSITLESARPTSPTLSVSRKEPYVTSMISMSRSSTPFTQMKSTTELTTPDYRTRCVTWPTRPSVSRRKPFTRLSRLMSVPCKLSRK